jgi:hypothetical protein
MRTVDDLRTALDDAGTPADVDIDAIRRRAHRQGYTAFAAVGVAVAVTVAVALPVAVLGGRRTAPTPPAVPTAAANCPNTFPEPLHNSGPGLADRLVPFDVAGALVCQYRVEQTMDPLGRTHYSVLTTSRILPLASARVVVARMEERRPGLSTGCAGLDHPAVVLQVLGAGRAVSLLLHGDLCLYATNGVLEKAVPTGQGMLKLLGGAPARLTCPARMPTDRGAAGPANRFVSFRPDRLLICGYEQPNRAGNVFAYDSREIDGAAAAALVRQLDALSTVPMPCPLRPGPRHSYIIEVTGMTGRTTLTGNDAGCWTVTNGRRTGFGVNWPALLAG